MSSTITDPWIESPCATPTPEPTKPADELSKRIRGLKQHQNTLLKLASKAKWLTGPSMMTFLKVFSFGQASTGALVVMSTSTGYRLAVGVTDVASTTAATITREAIHTANRIIGYAHWVAGIISRGQRERIIEASNNTTQHVAEFADTVYRGHMRTWDAAVDRLTDQRTERIVTTSSTILSLAIVANWISGGRISSVVSVIPTIGRPLAASLKGGKGSWLALAVIGGSALLYSIGAGIKDETGTE